MSIAWPHVQCKSTHRPGLVSNFQDTFTNKQGRTTLPALLSFPAAEQDLLFHGVQNGERQLHRPPLSVWLLSFSAAKSHKKP